MQFIDLAAQQARIKPQLDAAIARVLAHGRYVLGPEVEALEQRLADYVGVAHCIGCANGTDALQIALMALDIGPGDEVIVPGFTFVASAESVALVGARPVYVDIDPHTYLLDPALLEAAITPRTRAIMPVSMFGQCADMAAIGEVASRHGLAVVEDAAQSFGATQHGWRSGSLSRVATTSFFPSKPLGAYGDGGALFTDDPELAEAIRLVARHGEAKRYHHVRLGMNSRLDTLQAAVLLAKLDLFDEEVALRQAAAQRYDRLLGQAGIAAAPVLAPGNTSVYAQYSIRVANREAVQQRLAEAGIPTAVHYPVPLNRQPALAEPDSRLPVTDAVCEAILSLPMHPYLEAEQQERVVEALAAALAGEGEGGGTGAA
ncbi:DegT/DnrJ/EryC1/StrS family aminotransferase [Halomonas campisalis]|uniref:DegT/DnrJ/EryC1/StrS family aminotransferase n=1 Tax=Billgrantia campisalis TaxID=74661 RepID=A0ABS9P9E5_9GAMM|nr:DegT/DnrJ/EryC1/StrS family aminotransferase [Halomonas campisalis]MCG6657862.1 DegT/DnrJ/EryC1/StrS family aminotransferase [Halomonas campisalis]MDR5863614.1 DegT/DnrJ/EryC1/StrS family aminotransferase [Halomonas campisalis]